MVIIHEMYREKVCEKNLVRRAIIERDQYERMVSEDARRFFKARVQKGYTYLGYVPVRWTRRRWGDGVKFIDTWTIMKKVPEGFVDVYNKEMAN